MKKIISDENITFKITTERVVDLTPETPVFVQDDEAALLVSRLGQHVTVTDPTEEELADANIGVKSEQQISDESDADKLVSEQDNQPEPAEPQSTQPTLGAVCVFEDGTEGTYQDDPANEGSLVCTANAA